MIGMLKNRPLPDASWVRQHEMLTMVTLIAVIHFVIEAFIMLVLTRWMSAFDPWSEGLIDAALLTLLSTPPIYFWVVEPFIVSSRDAKAALAAEAADKAQLAAHREEDLTRLTSLLAHNEDLRANLKAAAQQIADLNERILQRVSADLHDGPAQLLTYAMMRLGKFEPIVATAGRAKDTQEFLLLKSALTDCLRQVRHTCNGLALPELDRLDLKATIRLAITQHNEQSGDRVNLSFADAPRDVPLAVKVCLYRVVQESLTNSHKHGQSTEQSVSVGGPHPLVMTITDKGVGFDTRQVKGAGLGIVGMRARLESIGGSLTVTAAPGEGTEVRARIDDITSEAGWKNAS